MEFLDDTPDFEALRQMAEQGDSNAQLELATLYADGDGVPQDAVLAAHWFSKSAHQGNPKAQFALGCCYMTGEGVEPNSTKAAEWFKKAAEQGDSDAQYNLARCYDIGDGIEQNQKVPSAAVSVNETRKKP